MKKILLGYKFPQEGLAKLKDEFELIEPDEGSRFHKDDILERLSDIDILVPNFSFKTDAEVIDRAPKLKLICNFGVGYDNIDVERATQRGIVVTNTPTAVLEPTAELCFALIIATARRIGYYNNKLHAGERVDWSSLYDDTALPIYGQTLGIFGMGRIGQAVARRALASGMKIIYHNRNRLDTAIEKLYDAQYVNFDQLLAQSDILSLNAPATSTTQNIIGAKELQKMKRSSILINTARGQLVDEGALISALRNSEIFGAGLDVFKNEPKINPGFLGLENVVLTPHAGTKTRAARSAMLEEVVNSILGFEAGGVIPRVN